MNTGIDMERLEEVASRLDLRPPNKEALESLVFELSQNNMIDRTSAFECVIDSATGVGKTYILVGGIEYLAAQGFRNFVVIAPGATIRDKTIEHFTPGHPKSLLGRMESEPLLITADNFDTPTTRTALDDDSRAKIYVFTVQSLTAPTSKQGRRTHEYQEALGAAFYDFLASLRDVVVFADEHHCYCGPSFSRAISDLNPYAIVGLTATPDPKTPEDSIIYRYPLAAAIAEKWVKTPVIVGRRDDRSDSLTKLADGVRLLSYKADAAADYCAELGLGPLKPVMLVVAQNTAEADEYAEILESDEFESGQWRDSILVVHSNLTGDAKERALAELQTVEDANSPIRIIISVGMLKEGWDAKNVYVIASMRASVSKVLTEQTLGRGLRLPFGQYTGRELLDTLEVIAHERYEQLLKSAGALNEQFVDIRTRVVLRKNSRGETVSVVESHEVRPPIIGASRQGETSGDNEFEPANIAAERGGVGVESLDQRENSMATQSDSGDFVHHYSPRSGMPAIDVPVLKMTRVQAEFSLSDITDLGPFRKLGEKISAEPESELRRMIVSAVVLTGPDGLRRTELVTSSSADKLEASSTVYPLLELRRSLVDAVLNSPLVANRSQEVHAADRIIDAFLEGVGGDAERLLSAYGHRAAARLLLLVADEHRKHLNAPHFEEVVELRPFKQVRLSKRKVFLDRTGPFVRSVAYDSFARSLYEADWFDSAPERVVANMVDDSEAVTCWVRLHKGELPILWRSDGREYNADLIVVETSGMHWVVEIKSDKDVTSADVQGKRKAAERWVNHVNDSGRVPHEWRYVLVTETDIEQAKGSWSSLKALSDD